MNRLVKHANSGGMRDSARRTRIANLGVWWGANHPPHDEWRRRCSKVLATEWLGKAGFVAGLAFVAIRVDVRRVLNPEHEAAK